MAAWWNKLRQEVRATIDDFREKGAVEALRDAALDTRDIAADASSWLVNGVKEFVTDGNAPCEDSRPVLRFDGVPTSGEMVMLVYPDGHTIEAKVTGTDQSSTPPCATVLITGEEEPTTVEIVPMDFQPQALASASPDLQDPDGTRAAGDAEGASLLDSLKQEWRNTVQDFRDKGAVGAVKDAAMDAAGIVGSTASSAFSGARSFVANSASSAETPLGSSAGSSGAPVVEEDSAQESPGLLGGLRQMGRNTVQELREKGAVGAVKDAALDAVDLVGSTAALALHAARPLVPEGTQVGGVAAASTGNDRAAFAPPSRTTQPSEQAEALDAAAETADARSAGAEAAVAAEDEDGESQSEEGTFLGDLQQDLHDTIQEFREKGAFGAFRDAALDARDMVGSTAVSAYNAAKPAFFNARSFAEPAFSNARSFAEPAISGARSLAEPALLGARTLAEPAISRARTFVAGTTATEEQAGTPAGSSSAEPAEAGSVTINPALAATSESLQQDDGDTPDMSDGSLQEGHPKRQSLVAMRRSAFEKPKEAEELID